MTITLRTQSQTGTTTKGSSLTHAELDDNFIDLLTNKINPIDVRGDSGTQLVGQSLTNEILQVVGGTGISTEVTSDSAGQAKVIITNTSAGATITDDTATNATRYILFEDVTTGNLTSVNVSSSKLTFNPSSGQMQVTELSTDSITSKSANSAIVIAPDGTGDVHLNADSVRIGDNNTDATLVTRGTGDLILTTNEGSGTEGVIRIYDGVNGNIELTPNGTGQVKIDYSLWPVSDGTASQVLSTNGSGVLSWTTLSGDVTGPGSSTDNAITRFDATTGKIIQNSQVTVADDGAITAPQVGSVIPFYFANQAAFPSAATYHGAIAHSHSDGKMYFAHSSVWNALANAADAFVPASPGEIGATTPDVGNFTDLKVKSASSTVKELQLHDQDNSNYVGFKAPTTVSSNKVWVLPATDGTNGQMLTTDGSATLSWTTASTELLTDTTPQLGGDLDVNTRKIVSTASGNIELQPDGGGDVYLTADTIRVGDNNANVTITTNGTGDLILNTNAGSSSGSITIEDGSNGDITLAPNGTGRVEILGTANQQAGIRLFEELSSAGNTQSTLLQASKFISADITLTLPNTTSTLGYQNLPAVGTKTGSYTLATGDVGKYVQVGSGGSITIPNATFAEGDVIVIVNNHTAAITITCTITDAYIGGTNTDKATVSLATRGVCNILFLSGTACIITGNVS
jgi:hypothetical protein